MKFFEADKTYIEVAPYRAPEATAVFKVEWVGTMPGTTNTVAFGWVTDAAPGGKWQPRLDIMPEDAEGDFSEDWHEAVQDDEKYWKAKVPDLDTVMDEIIADPKHQEIVDEALKRAKDSSQYEDDPEPKSKHGDQGTCARCGERIEYYSDEKSGGFWSHLHHPADNHDAVIGGPA